MSRVESRAPHPGVCISCARIMEDDETMNTEVPTCQVCGAPQISDASQDWLNTELY